MGECLPENQQRLWRRRLQRAYERPTYSEAKKRLEQLEKELRLVNESAAASLREGMEESLTFHRLGRFAVPGHSFKTSNCFGVAQRDGGETLRQCRQLEDLESETPPDGAALLDIELRPRCIRGYRHLPKLRLALKRELRKGTHELRIPVKRIALSGDVDHVPWRSALGWWFLR